MLIITTQSQSKSNGRATGTAASHLTHFLTNRCTELTVPPLWPVNCLKIRGLCCTSEWPYCLFVILSFVILWLRAAGWGSIG